MKVKELKKIICELNDEDDVYIKEFTLIPK